MMEGKKMTGPELRAARKLLGLTQAALAGVLGYSHQREISRLEARDRVPGPVALSMRAMLEFGLPNTWDHVDTPTPPVA